MHLSNVRRTSALEVSHGPFSETRHGKQNIAVMGGLKRHHWRCNFSFQYEGRFQVLWAMNVAEITQRDENMREKEHTSTGPLRPGLYFLASSPSPYPFGLSMCSV